MDTKSLAEAIDNNDLETFKKALEEGFDLSLLIDRYTGNALHYAILMQSWEIIEILLDTSIDINALSPDGDHPFIEVCWLAKADIIEKMIAKGVDVNTVGKRQKTALMAVCSSSEGQLTESIKVLLNAKADVKAIDGKQRTALFHLIESVRSRGTAKLMGNDDSASGGFGAFFGTISKVIGVSKQMMQGNNVLASSEEDLKAATMLIEAGLDVNHQDDCGFKAIHFAKKHPPEDTAMIELLTQHGASWTEEDETLLGNIFSAEADYDDEDEDDDSWEQECAAWEEEHFSAEAKESLLSSYAHDSVSDEIEKLYREDTFTQAVKKVSEFLKGVEPTQDDAGLYRFEAPQLEEQAVRPLQDELNNQGFSLLLSQRKYDFSNTEETKTFFNNLILFPSTDPLKFISFADFQQGNIGFGLEQFLLRFKALEDVHPFRMLQFDWDTVAGEYLEPVTKIDELLDVIYALEADDELYREEKEEEDHVGRLTEEYSSSRDFFFWWD